MKAVPLRSRSITALFRANPLAPTPRAHPPSLPPALRPAFFSPHRTLAQVQSTHDLFNDTWFTGSGPAKLTPEECGLKVSGPQPDDRTLKLGKTLRVLQSRLPTLFASPLPPEILSPQITLHLFPSTHPHLPSASGRVAYHAALWTSPITWGRVPLVGNVTLDILSERMLSSPPGQEKLIVYWKTMGKTKGKGMGALYRGIGAGERVDKITEWLGGDVRDDQEFMGKFIFEFDEEGRVLVHTIECAEDVGGGEVGRFVNITDWLLGKAMGKKEVKGLVVGCEGVVERVRGRETGKMR